MQTDAEREGLGGTASEVSSGSTAAGGVGPFVTWVAQEQAGRAQFLHTSRRHRKGLSPLAVAVPGVVPHAIATDPRSAGIVIRHEWLHLWAPLRIGWWIAILFMIGSALFAVGGAKATWPHALPDRFYDPGLIGWTFFIGSFFFTSAAYLQWLEALNSIVADAAQPTAEKPRRWRFLGWRPHNLGYLSALVQLVGTILFNVNTAVALIAGLGWEGQDLLVWTPDVVGSICFLLASQLALMEVSHHYWILRPRSVSDWIAWVNMLGSLLFMISAVTSFVEPGPVMVAPWVANFTTFAGGVCFFVGAYLLIPEQFERQVRLPRGANRRGGPGEPAV